MADHPIQWVCAKCGTIMGDEQSERVVRELRANIEATERAINAPNPSQIRIVAEAIVRVWRSENKEKGLDMEQAITLFEPSARAAIAATAKLLANA